MAPRKPEAAAPVSKSNTKANKKDRVAKRPPCGFHRFRSGILNVSPKSRTEKEIVAKNQESPLLSPPAEIRAKIWKYALGGHRLIRPIGQRQGRVLDLLRVCRQVYSETVLVPYKCNTFVISNDGIRHTISKELAPLQRRNVEEIEVEVDNLWIFHTFAKSKKKDLLHFLPNLRRINILLRTTSDRKELNRKSAETDLRNCFSSQDAYDQVEVSYNYLIVG